jgi:phosphoglycolate phosphatase
MKYRAVIFDLDGTLLDTLYDLGNSGNILLNRYSFPVHPIEKYKAFIGDGAKKLVERILPAEKRENGFIEKLTKEFKEIYAENCDVNTKTFPGIEALLEELRKKNIKMSILSNKPHELTMQVVKNHLPENSFEIVRGHIDGEPRKPDASIAVKMVHKMGLSALETIFLGDMENDINTALNGKFYPVAVSWGMRSKEQLSASGAKIIIEKPLDLLKMFE